MGFDYLGIKYLLLALNPGYFVFSVCCLYTSLFTAFHSAVLSIFLLLFLLRSLSSPSIIQENGSSFNSILCIATKKKNSMKMLSDLHEAWNFPEVVLTAQENPERVPWCVHILSRLNIVFSLILIVFSSLFMC